MSPDQVTMIANSLQSINNNLLSINEKQGALKSEVQNAVTQIEKLRNDIIDIYDENKEDRKICEAHRAEINKKIDEQAVKAEEKAEKEEVKTEGKQQTAFENKYIRISAVIGCISVLIAGVGIFIGIQ